jgi:hypothetical protein
VYHFIATLQNSGCGTRTANYYFSANTSISPPRLVSYNPTSSILTVDFGDEPQTAITLVSTKKATTVSYIVKVFDFNGALVQQGTSAGENISFNLVGKPNGIYLVNIYDASSNSLLQTLKFLKEY